MKFDLEKPGLSKVFRDYQIEAMRFLWDMKGDGAVSREVWAHVNEALGAGKSISRASIINFLDGMAEEGFLDYRDTTAKGGRKRIYRPSPKAPDEETFRRVLADRLKDRV